MSLNGRRDASLTAFGGDVQSGSSLRIDQTGVGSAREEEYRALGAIVPLTGAHGERSESLALGGEDGSAVGVGPVREQQAHRLRRVLRRPV